MLEIKKDTRNTSVLEIWRRERDSNPWTANAVNGFRDRPIRPLWHLSIHSKQNEKLYLALIFGVQNYYFFFT